ncbi:MAG: hypothetical protein J0G29_05590, partial [Alphaproteobacteria bacterium]|nr:hypothetical protein [Alphaproteobacteria bacterium]
ANLSSQFHFIYTNDFVNLFIYSHIECSSSLIFIKGSTHLSNLAKLIVRYRFPLWLNDFIWNTPIVRGLRVLLGWFNER